MILATLVSAVFRLERSHFAEREDYGNWGHLGTHVVGHLIEIVALFVVLLLLMALVQLLWRWPVTVGPGVVIGALVVIRYWLEAMGVPGSNTAAWSSTVAALIAGFYLGGVGPLLGLRGGRQLLTPALVLGWTWRLWVYIATLMSAMPTAYRTHFFDRSHGNVQARLAQALAGTAVESCARLDSVGNRSLDCFCHAARGSSVGKQKAESRKLKALVLRIPSPPWGRG